MDPTVSDVPERSRYEIAIDGQTVGFADYQVHGDVVVLPHTVVSPALRGQGLADQLIRHVLDDIRARDCSVSPVCSYVARFIERNPDDADLLTG